MQGIQRYYAGGFSTPIEIAEHELSQCVDAVQRTHQDLTFCSLSALKVLGFVVPRHHRLSDDEVHVMTMQQQKRSEIAGVRFRVWDHPVDTQLIPVRSGQGNFVEYVRVVDAVTACMQMLAYCPKEECVVMFDALMCRDVKLRQATRDELEEMLRSLGHFRGCRVGKWALKHSVEGVDSPMETRLRLQIIEWGLPTPVVNMQVTDPDSGEFWFLDLAYPELMIGFEFQGEQFHANVEGLRRDSRKMSALQGLGWRIVPITADMLRTGQSLEQLFTSIERIIAIQKGQLHFV